MPATDKERTATGFGRLRARTAVALGALAAIAGVAAGLPAAVPAEQASQPTSPAAARLDAGAFHTCALVASGRVRCWGFSGDGQLGYGNRQTVGDDETPGSLGTVDLGAGRRATAISAGDSHSCAVLDDRNVRCWGFNADGQLGYGNTSRIGDDEVPGSVGPVKLGPGRTAVAIAAGGAHSCAVLDDGSVRCWGFGGSGELGYGNNQPGVANNVGDDETPDTRVPVNLGTGRTARAITAGARHTCALLDNGSVRCWGAGAQGQLGNGNQNSIGDDETPDTAGPVNLGTGRTATAISAGDFHTCARLDDGTVRCWGFGANGALGYGNPNNIGDNEAPASVGPVNLGGGRTATGISAGGDHTCAVLDDGTVRCWGFGANGRLGYGEATTIGDNEAPGSVGPVKVGLNRTATAVSGGRAHTCARLDDGNVRCWGLGLGGRLGYCNENSIGDDETPDSAGPVALESPGPACASPDPGATGGGSGATPGGGGAQASGGNIQPSPSVTPSGGGLGAAPSDPVALQAQRARELRTCIAKTKRMRRKRDSARRACLKRYGRTPGRIKGLRARAVSKKRIVVSFTAPGTDGSRPPAAWAYLVKQSSRAIRGARDFTRAQSLCKGNCRFKVTRVGTRINLTITDLRPKTTYYYAIAARDNVSQRLGPRSAVVKARTR